MKILSHKGFLIKKDGMTPTEIAKLKKDLFVSPIQIGSDFQISDKFPVFRESESRFRIPRFYGISTFGTPINQLDSGISIDVTFTGQLKKETFQDIACEKCIETLSTKGGGILSLGTGFGKTTCALYILSHFKVKTLIIVHKEFLMNQWIERIHQFLPSASIGIIQQNKIDTKKDIVIAMLQSLSMKEYTSDTFKGFGFTIIDETHHVCSKVFSRALFSYTSKMILGLSATPNRKDGLTRVLHWFIGDIIFQAGRENEKNVEIVSTYLTYPLYSSEPPLNVLGKVNLPEIINQIVVIPERNAKIIELIKDSLQEQRKIIVLSDRRKHCETLLESLVSQNISAGLYMGGMHQSVLKENESCDVILATYSLAHEGLDIPSLNTLIFATPKTDIVQSAGRILRETGNKSHYPKIYDLIDTYGPLPNQYKKRLQYYKKAGFNINDPRFVKKEKKEPRKFQFVEE
jgi:superfamily II DNA or RNA helicase